ncbi:hypothetical protein Ccrd_025472 [Cynara cardunculus var. scolymus]|uniref:TRF2/HOY1 PH-like domain-containing protein n=1 Tax=Cynara cardunculus var. scolymus TaxID=59895 RepID=A0A103X3C3_CYNCS|nr:hypothetical protein Ccrd_025472 [Cynara cardunculus var. scolymus]
MESQRNQDHSSHYNEAGGPFGLSLTKSPSLIKELEFILNKEKQPEEHQEQFAHDQSAVKKLKATNIPAVFLKIGSWKWVSKNEGDLVAKFYYGRKKVIWEFLYGSLKKKIEIQWSHISAINSFVGEDKKGVLEIDLSEQPEYGQEVRFQAGKHTLWEPSGDFTQGQSSVCRRHTVVFLPGVLDEAFMKLLQCDSRLFNVSRRPFPTHNSTLFCNQILDFSNNRSFVHGSSSVPAVSNYGHQGMFLPPAQNTVQKQIVDGICEESRNGQITGICPVLIHQEALENLQSSIPIMGLTDQSIDRRKLSKMGTVGSIKPKRFGAHGISYGPSLTSTIFGDWQSQQCFDYPATMT